MQAPSPEHEHPATAIAANAAIQDKGLLEQYSWDAYISLPPVMKGNIEVALMREVLSGGISSAVNITVEMCANLLRDIGRRDLFLRCWKSGSFTDLRIDGRFIQSVYKDLGIALKGNEISNDNLGGLAPKSSVGKETRSETVALAASLPSAQDVIVAGGTFYDVTGDVWQIVYLNDHQQMVATWLSQVDQRTTHNEIWKKRVPTTGVWFLQSKEFKELCEDPQSRTLWCPGMPGVGKTVMSSLVINHLRKTYSQKAAIGFVYFDYKLRSRQNLTAVLESLCRQVYETSKISEVATIFQSLFEGHREDNSRPSASELQTTLTKAFLHYEGCYLVLDALDEYLEQYSDKKIRELLDTLLSLGTHVKVLATSRPLTGFDEVFQQLGGARRQIDVADEDLRQYLEQRIDGDEFNFDIDDSLRTEIIDTVTRVAAGRFLMATLLMDSLSEQLNPGGLEDELQRLPEGIDAAYARVMERIEGHNESRKKLAKKAIMLVAYATRPLSVDEFQHALATKPNLSRIERYITPLSTITAACAGILVVRDRTVVFVHFTAQEYFEKPENENLHFPQANPEIARMCIDYLSQDILSDSTLSDDFPPEIEQRLPFYGYAAENWGRHTPPDDEALRDHIWAFISENRIAVRHNINYTLHNHHEWVLESSDPIGEDSDAGAGVFLAVYHCELRALSLLIDQVQAVPTTTLGCTPLILARTPKHVPAIKKLVTKFGVDIQPYPGCSILAFAANYGLDEAMEFLFSCPNIDTRATGYGRTPLHHAIIHRNFSAAEIILERGRWNSTSRLEASSVSASELLHRPAPALSSRPEHGSLRDQQPIEAVNEPDNRGMTLLMDLAQSRDVANTTEAIRFLLHHGADVTIQDEDGMTALAWAAANGSAPIIQTLIEYGALQTLNLADSSGIAPISYAARQFYTRDESAAAAAVALLLAQDGLDCHTIDSYNRTPLYRAYEAGFRREVVPLLRSRGIQLIPSSLPSAKKLGLFFRAAADGVKEVIEILLQDGGIDGGERDEMGRTALSYAAQEGHVEVVNSLSRGRVFHVNSRDEEGRTPLIYATLAFRGDSTGRETIVRSLLQEGANVNSRDKYGICALTFAVCRHYSGIVSQLLAHSSIDPNLQSAEGITPLGYGIGYDVGALPMLLSDPRMDVNIKDKHGRTPLMLACLCTGRMCADVVQLLLGRPLLDVNTRDESGRTALICAMGYRVPPWDEQGWELLGCPPINPPFDRKPFSKMPRTEFAAKMLVSALLVRDDIDINLADYEGKTPLWYAQVQGFHRISRLLKARGAVEVREPAPA